MVRWHHLLNGPEFELIPGVADGQGGLAGCGPKSRKESDTAQLLNDKKRNLPPELSFDERD